MRFAAYILAALPAVHALDVSKNARCGLSFGLTCQGSRYGNCCSQYNYCGKTSDYCALAKGCQLGFGSCSGSAQPSTQRSSSTIRSLTLRTSTRTSDPAPSTAPQSCEPITLTVPSCASTPTITLPGEISTTTVTLSGTTVTIPTTISLPGEEPEPITVTIPTTVTLPGEAPEPVISTVTSTATIASCAAPNPATTQAVVNPSFETSDSWTFNGGLGTFQYVTGNQNSGDRALQFSASLPLDLSYSFAQTVTLFPGAVYRLSFFAKASVSNNCAVRANLGATSIASANRVLSTSYVQITGAWYPDASGATSALLTISGTCAQGSGSRAVYFDDVTLSIEGFYTPRV